MTLLSRDSRSADMEEDEEDDFIDVGMDKKDYYYVVCGDQDGHRLDNDAVFMKKGWNRRSGRMPSEFIEMGPWSQ